MSFYKPQTRVNPPTILVKVKECQNDDDRARLTFTKHWHKKQLGSIPSTPENSITRSRHYKTITMIEATLEGYEHTHG